MRKISVVTILLACSACYSSEPLNLLYEKAVQYIKVFDPTEVQQKKIIKAFLERAEQRAKEKDSNSVEELNNILVDYLWDNMGKLEKQDKGCIFTVCTYFRFYVEQKLVLPRAIATALTGGKIDKLIEALNIHLAQKD